MRLQPNIGSDRSWVWKVAADYAESLPTSETLAIRFANSDSKPEQFRIGGVTKVILQTRRSLRKCLRGLR